MSKFRKPNRDIRLECGGNFVTECVRFVDSLPDEFEIVPEGHVCVKWPDGLTRERLARAARDLHDIVATCGGELCNPASANGRNILEDLADIAPERKKRMCYLYERDDPILKKVRVWDETDHAKLEPGWRKVAGPIDIDD